MNNKYVINNYEDPERWYVLYTRPNMEKQVNKNLKAFGFNSYLPLQKELRHWNDRNVWIETPLFRSYVFLKIRFKTKDLVFKVNGILKYVCIGPEFAILTEQEISRIKQLCLYEGKITIDFERLKAGKEVEICEGVLKGLRGCLLEISDNRKIRISIESLNCFASVTIDFDSVSLRYIH